MVECRRKSRPSQHVAPMAHAQTACCLGLKALLGWVFLCVQLLYVIVKIVTPCFNRPLQPSQQGPSEIVYWKTHSSMGSCTQGFLWGLKGAFPPLEITLSQALIMNLHLVSTCIQQEVLPPPYYNLCTCMIYVKGINLELAATVEVCKSTLH